MKTWADFLPEPEYRRIFDTRKFREATEPSPEEKRSWTADAIRKFREATKAKELQHRAQAMAVKRQAEQRLELKKPAIAEETPYEKRRRRGQVPEVPTIVSPGLPPEETAIQRRYQAAGEPGLLSMGFEPLLPQPAREAIRRVPVVGPVAEPMIAGLTTPVGLASLAAWPAVTARMTAGAIIGGVAGQTAERAGAPVAQVGPVRIGPRAVGEAIGTVAGPVIGPAIERAAVRGAAKVAEVAVSPEIASFRRAIGATVAEEAGGLKPRVPEEPRWVLTNDVPTPAEINKRMNQLARVEKKTAKQTREYRTLLAQKDLNTLRTTGTLDEQMDALDTEIKDIGQELELRAARHEYTPTKAPNFGTPERAEWEAARKGTGRVKWPGIGREDIEVLRTRLKVFQEFRDNMAIMPAQPGEAAFATQAAEEPLVTRARFTEKGEVVQEPTFATERELAGIREQQMGLGIGAGERPIETAGPLFAKPEGVTRIQPEAVSADIASFRAATEAPAPVTPGMSKAERLAQWKAGYKPEAPAAAPQAPVRGPQPVGKEAALARWRAGYEPERLATPERPTVEVPIEDRPIPPGTAPPTGGPPTSIGDAMSGEPSTPGGLLARFLDRMPGRDVGKSDWAKFEGGLGAEGKEIELWTRETQNLERKLGIKPGPERTPEKEAIIKALHGEGTVDPRYQPLVDRLKAFLADHEQRTLADVPAFEKKMLPQYWPRGWRNPEVFSGGEPLTTPTVRTGKLGPGQIPGTLRARTLPKTFTEAVEMGGQPISWDPAQQIGLHAAELADYRYSQVVAELWKMETRATPKSVAPNSWQTPDYPAFQSRPYVTKEGAVGWSEPLVVSPEDFSLLENMLGRRPPGMEDAAAYVASVFKRIKVAGGFFQYFDLQNRALWRSATRGELNALPAAVRAWAGTFIPPLRPKLWKALMADPVVKEGTEEGLQLVGGLDTWKRTMRAAIEPDLVLKFPVLGEIPTGKLPVGVANKVRAVQRGLNSIEGYLAGGLYDSAHPQFVSTVYKSIRAELANKYPNYTSRQLSALAADHANVLMSSVPDWESVLGPRLRQLGRATAFSINENEAWLRQITRPVTSANRSLYLRQWSGYIFGTLATAELINYGMTGKLLGQDQLAPIVLQNGRPTYNTRFARPQLDGLGPVGKLVGITGPQGRHIYLDLMGQADTPFRLFAPQFFVMSRLSTPLSVSVQELQSRTFFGQQPLETTGEKAGFAVEQGLIPIPAVGFGEERGRIGTGGAAIQAAGWNVSAESNAQLLKRLVPGWGGMTKGQKQDAADANPQVAAVWNQQLERGLERGEQWAETKQQAQQDADEFGASVLAAYNKPGITGADIMDSVTDFLQKRAHQAEIRYAGVTFKANSDDQKLLDAYYEITMPDVPTAAERNEFFDKQDAFITANPRVKELIRQNHQAIFSDPQMKAVMAEIDAARDVRSEYYSIPAKLGYSAEEEAELAPWAAQAAAMKSTYGYSPRRALDALGLDPDLTTRVLRYMNRSDNPARARYWRQNPDKKVLFKQFYSELPLSVPAEEMEVAGVR